MENASKALLIAGAILIAILLIAIGMMVFNNASGVIDTATSNMSAQEKTAFNKQFSVYQGTQSGSVTKELIALINSNNSIEGNQDVTLAGDTTSTTNVVNQAQYTITFTETNGVITTCTINKVK